MKAITVTIQSGRTLNIEKVLGDGDKNVKLSKGKDSEYMTMGLSLSPWKSVKGYNTCPNATLGCIASCIFTSGFASVFPNVNEGREARTIAWYTQRKLFKEKLVHEIKLAQARAERKGKKLCVRLNVFSDLKWETLFPSLFKQFPDVQFYDYTKDVKRAKRRLTDAKWPSNYYLTFSRSETNEAECREVLEMGGNVAAVFSGKDIPCSLYDHKVINGDATDLRFLDEQGVVVGLYAKGQGKKDTTGFVIPLEMV